MADRDAGDGEGRERFLVDAMCGSLATYLRMCGYDATYALERGLEADDALVGLARSEGRRLVTRDLELAERREDAIALASRDVTEQLRELVDLGVGLELPEEPRRCSACNGRLQRVDAAVQTPEYAPNPAERPVWRCVDCGQHFWKGSHWDDVEATLSEV